MLKSLPRCRLPMVYSYALVSTKLTLHAKNEKLSPMKKE
jgi:hypothetical protein